MKYSPIFLRASSASLALFVSALGFAEEPLVGSTAASPKSIPVPADYDGDGKADLSLFNGRSWKIDYSENGFSGWDVSFSIEGCNSDSTPMPRDYDGDGKADVAVFSAKTGVWKINYSSTKRKGWDVEYSIRQSTTPQLKQILGPEIAAAVLSIRDAKFCRIGPKKTTQPNSLAGFPKLAPLKPIASPNLAKLTALLQDKDTYLPKTIKYAKFFPEYGVAISTDKGMLTVLIAPDSRQLQMILGENRMIEDFDPVAEKMLSLFFQTSEKSDDKE